MGSFNLHTIKTNRFKNIRMEIHFRNNVDPETLVKRTLLFELLLESSKNYPTKRDIILKCEELYNATLYAKSSKVGNEVINTVVFDFLNPEYTNDDYLSEAIELPFDIIFNPNVDDDLFNEEKLNTIKLRNIAEVSSLKEQPSKYCILKALEVMDKKSVSSLSLLGNEESINRVTPSNIYQEYLNILEHDYVDIFVIGNIDENEIVNLVNQHQHFNTIKTHELTMYVNNKPAKKRTVKDKSDFTQSHINFIININNLTEEERSYTAHLFNHILGGSSLDTRLYQKLRGENSLCYGVKSIYNKYDRLIIITTSVDHANVGKAKKLIEDTIKGMKSITENELNNAKQAIITSINMTLDSPTQIISNYLFNAIADLDLVEDRIEKYQSITTKDVEKLTNKISINTIYIMEAGHENN